MLSKKEYGLPDSVAPCCDLCGIELQEVGA